MDINSIARTLFRGNTISDIMIDSSIVLLVSFNVYIYIYEFVLNHFKIDRRFSEIMNVHTDQAIVCSDKTEKISWGFSWGDDKTVSVCDDILYGWMPEDIVVVSYKDEKYRFRSEEHEEKTGGDHYFNEYEYQKFINTKEFKKVIAEKSNLPRFMLTGFRNSPNKKYKQLQLFVQRTEWSQCSYVWRKCGENRALLSECATGIVSGMISEYLPNSLCLHLIVETSDDKIVMSRISQNKFNDKPGRWAVTLGEQIEREDFADGNDFYQGFVYNWVRRAFKEEYRIAGELYERILSEKNIRLLAIDFEGDIYNFALVCFVRVDYSFEKFENVLQTRLDTSEASEIKALNYEEIPHILMNYPDNKDQYHPSSYLRMMLAYMHRFGIDKTQRDIISEKNRLGSLSQP